MEEELNQIIDDEFDNLPDMDALEDPAVEDIDALLDGDREMSERLSALGVSLQLKADESVAHRAEIEGNWMDDLKQFNGEYSDVEKSRLKASGGSMLFANITRPKVNAAEARISDILFPTDDTNWDIRATPVPELYDFQESETPVGMTPEGNEVQERDVAAGLVEEATIRAKKMKDEMNDQLIEANWASVCREIIHDAVLMGTGILKGVTVYDRVSKRWNSIQDENGNTARVLEMTMDKRPTCERVDPWDFFPDMSARKIDEAEFVLQRHVMSRKELRALAKQEGYLAGQINDILVGEGEDTPTATHLEEMRSMAGISLAKPTRYEVWEYHGELDKKDLEACGCDVDTEDELDVVSGIVWFVDGKVIRATVNILDTEDMPYSVFTWEQSGTSIFGIGVPRLMNNSQRAMNASWRMAMDNAGLSTAPQIVINEGSIEPVDGDWAIRPRKIWRAKGLTANVQQAFGTFEINGHLQELLALFNVARELADEEAGLPSVAQGEAGAQPVNTATGMSILMNSANTVLRRAIKAWDDGITLPFIQRLYDWNMQFSENEEAKGDMQIHARGSSHLIVKEMQAQNAMALINIAGSPLLQPLTDVPALYRRVVTSMQIDPNEVVKTDAEIEQEMQMQQQMMQQQQQPAVDPLGQAHLELKQQQIQQDGQLKQAQLQQDGQVAMAKLQQADMASQRASEAKALGENYRGDVADKKIGVDMMRENNRRLEMAMKEQMGSGI